MLRDVFNYLLLRLFFCYSLQAQSHEIIEIFAKTLYQLELNRLNVDTMWGFSIEAELVENKDKQDELCCFVSRVEERSVASGNGNSRVFLVRQIFFSQLFIN